MPQFLNNSECLIHYYLFILIFQLYVMYVFVYCTLSHFLKKLAIAVRLNDCKRSLYITCWINNVNCEVHDTISANKIYPIASIIENPKTIILFVWQTLSTFIFTHKRAQSKFMFLFFNVQIAPVKQQ